MEGEFYKNGLDGLIYLIIILNQFNDGLTHLLGCNGFCIWSLLLIVLEFFFLVLCVYLILKPFVPWIWKTQSASIDKRRKADRNPKFKNKWGYLSTINKISLLVAFTIGILIVILSLTEKI